MNYRAATVSVCVICFNEERNIRRCLESVVWADEIIVVDSLSQDKTVRIARAYTDKVYERAWTGYANQKNFALSKATGEWVVSLDADEEVSSPLCGEIEGVITSRNAEAGYRIPRRSFYQGRWINHSGFYPDRQLRLFKRSRGRWVGGRVHERVAVDGEVGDLTKDLLHYPYKGNISGMLSTIDEFAELKAHDMYDKKRRYHAGLLLLRPPIKFFEVYFLKLGCFDGVAGFIIAVSSAYTLFVQYVKLRELGIQ